MGWHAPSVTLAVLALCCAYACTCSATPLDDYINAPDSHYEYYDTGIKLEGLGWTGFVLNMTSQKWLDDSVIHPSSEAGSIWWHFLTIIVPHESHLKYNGHGFLYISEGSNKPTPPKIKDEDIILCSTVARNTGIVGAVLNQIPNQPYVFADEPGHRRTEDAVIAYTWDKFMTNYTTAKVQNPANWLLRLPMTKAVVRAMDTVEDFMAYNLGQHVHRFHVAGASKRGWTTWTAAAVDARIESISPIVMDLLNMRPNLHNMYRNYGGWTFAFDDYYTMNFTEKIDSPELEMLADVVDPYVYRDRFTMPKMVLSSTGDEFFQMEDNKYWYDDMPGETNLLITKNAEHSMITGIPEIIPALEAFIVSVVSNVTRPKMFWEIDPNTGAITVTTDSTPSEVNIVHAKTLQPKRRDFRLITGEDPCPFLTVKGMCIQPVLWETDSLKATEPGKWVAQMEAPLLGWRAFFVEMKFPLDNGDRHFRFTTQVSIVPLEQPFADCRGSQCKGELV